MAAFSSSAAALLARFGEANDPLDNCMNRLGLGTKPALGFGMLLTMFDPFFLLDLRGAPPNRQRG